LLAQWNADATPANRQGFDSGFIRTPEPIDLMGFRAYP
jgi:hypothetical protein